MYHQSIDVLMPKLKYAGLEVIDPDDGVVVAAHTLLPYEE